MNDLIKREDAIQSLIRWSCSECGLGLDYKKNKGFCEGICHGASAIKVIESIPTADNSIALLPNGELLVDTEYTDQVESVRLMNYEGFTRVFDEPKVGRWIDAGWDGEKCSLCGWNIDDTYYSQQFNYCPNCGAKMERSE